MNVSGGQKIGPRGQELAELDEGRPHLFQIPRQFIGARLGRQCLVKRLDSESFVQASIGQHVRAPILDQQKGDVFVALQMLRL